MEDERIMRAMNMIYESASESGGSHKASLKGRTLEEYLMSNIKRLLCIQDIDAH